MLLKGIDIFFDTWSKEFCAGAQGRNRARLRFTQTVGMGDLIVQQWQAALGFATWHLECCKKSGPVFVSRSGCLRPPLSSLAGALSSDLLGSFRRPSFGQTTFPPYSPFLSEAESHVGQLARHTQNGRRQRLGFAIRLDTSRALPRGHRSRRQNSQCGKRFRFRATCPVA